MTLLGMLQAAFSVVSRLLDLFAQYRMRKAFGVEVQAALSEDERRKKERAREIEDEIRRAFDPDHPDERMRRYQRD